jgi:hypothetical protein
MVAQDKKDYWYQGHIDPWWGLKHRDLEWIGEPFNDPQTVKLWREIGFWQERFHGDMYDMRFVEPSWIDQFRQHFPWEAFAWSVYKMTPGRVLPEHADLFLRFKKIYNVEDVNQIWRAVVFLEDWQQGHYLDIDKTPVVSWRAGDFVAWRGETLHTAANVGMTDRYTLQITGIIR